MNCWSLLAGRLCSLLFTRTSTRPYLNSSIQLSCPSRSSSTAQAAGLLQAATTSSSTQLFSTYKQRQIGAKGGVQQCWQQQEEAGGAQLQPLQATASTRRLARHGWRHQQAV